MSDSKQCPACERKLGENPWLSCEGGHYQDENFYECDHCGTLPKDFVDAVNERIEEIKSWRQENE